MLGWFRVSGCFFFSNLFWGIHISTNFKKGWFFILQTLTKYNTYRKFGIQNGGQGSVSKKIKKFVIVRAKTKKKKKIDISEHQSSSLGCCTKTNKRCRQKSATKMYLRLLAGFLDNLLLLGAAFEFVIKRILFFFLYFLV